MEQRLQKLISAAGIASRRHAEELITKGEVSINGKTVTELGLKADPDRDHIKVKGRLINPLLKQHQSLYVLLYKPRGYLTSMADPEGRPLVTDLLPSALGRLHPVGRLDFNTEGLLLLTNDGDFTNHVTSAKNRIPKVYQVKVKGLPPENAIERLRRGISIDEAERTARADVRKLRMSKTNSWFEVILVEGRNQQIRRMFDAIGHSVIKLARTRIGAVEDQRLKPGAWRKLTAAEVGRLKSPQPGRGKLKERNERPARRVARKKRASQSR
jgi:23S rRNA pseudouridine2605 synthase